VRRSTCCTSTSRGLTRRQPYPLTTRVTADSKRFGPTFPFHSMETGTRQFMRGPRRFCRVRMSFGRSRENGIASTRRVEIFCGAEGRVAARGHRTNVILRASRRGINSTSRQAVSLSGRNRLNAPSTPHRIRGEEPPSLSYPVSTMHASKLQAFLLLMRPTANQRRRPA
jgi:hypothetical protein